MCGYTLLSGIPLVPVGESTPQISSSLAGDQGRDLTGKVIFSLASLPVGSVWRFNSEEAGKQKLEKEVLMLHYAMIRSCNFILP